MDGQALAGLRAAGDDRSLLAAIEDALDAKGRES